MSWVVISLCIIVTVLSYGSYPNSHASTMYSPIGISLNVYRPFISLMVSKAGSYSSGSTLELNICTFTLCNSPLVFESVIVPCRLPVGPEVTYILVIPLLYPFLTPITEIVPIEAGWITIVAIPLIVTPSVETPQPDTDRLTPLIGLPVTELFM